MTTSVIVSPAAVVFIPAFAALGVLLLMRHLQKGRGTIVIPNPTTRAARQTLTSLIVCGIVTLALGTLTLSASSYDWPERTVHILRVATSLGAGGTAVSALIYGWLVG